MVRIFLEISASVFFLFVGDMPDSDEAIGESAVVEVTQGGRGSVQIS